MGVPAIDRPLAVALACAMGLACPEKPDPSPDTEDTAPISLPGFCEERGLASLAFSEGPTGSDYGDTVADFALNTLEGPWSFSENWTGCDTYIFLMHASGYDLPDQVWNSSVKKFLDASPANVHYFFLSYDEGSEEERVQAIRDHIEPKLGRRDAEEQDHWRSRLHYVTDNAWTAGAVGEALSSRGAWAIGIDRRQRFREVGHLGDPTSGWEGKLKFATHEPQLYNHEIERDSAVASWNATSVTTFDGSPLSSGYVEFELPSAETMAGFDTMHLDLELSCGDSYPENCGEWDYLVHAYVCDRAEVENPYAAATCQPFVAATATEDESPAETQACACIRPDGDIVESTYTCGADGTGYEDCACSCDEELGRWVTAYSRSGRWVSDVSPLLAVFPQGGTQQLRFSSSYSYENTLTIHLSSSGKGGTPKDIHPLFTGGSFNENYNSRYAPIEIEIPSDMVRVELFAVISGHGWGAEIDNCAEFCNHTHHFEVNGVEFTKEHPFVGNDKGCIDQIGNGTVPNQFGTWPYGRGGWCPGKQVDPWIVDVTDAVTAGETATVTYRGLFQGADYVPRPSTSGQGFGANINMRSHLVVSR
jgi:hypothetical protein